MKFSVFNLENTMKKIKFLPIGYNLTADMSSVSSIAMVTEKVLFFKIN